MAALLAFLNERRKAIVAFIGAEAGSFLLLLQSDAELGARNIVIAALIPLVPAALVERTTNK